MGTNTGSIPHWVETDELALRGHTLYRSTLYLVEATGIALWSIRMKHNKAMFTILVHNMTLGLVLGSVAALMYSAIHKNRCS